jgi:hypothetical protein
MVSPRIYTDEHKCTSDALNGRLKLAFHPLHPLYPCKNIFLNRDKGDEGDNRNGSSRVHEPQAISLGSQPEEVKLAEASGMGSGHKVATLHLLGAPRVR